MSKKHKRLRLIRVTIVDSKGRCSKCPFRKICGKGSH